MTESVVSDDDDGDERDEIFDDNKAQIEEQLEVVNDASICVNKLQQELNMCDFQFNQTLELSKNELFALRGKVGLKHIDRATSYYKLLDEKKTVQIKAEQAAKLYHHSMSEWQAAKESLELTQQAPPDQNTSSQQTFETWEEYLCLMKQKVIYAEQEMERCRYEHQLHSKQFCSLNDQLVALRKKAKESVDLAESFFLLKKRREFQLGEIQNRRKSLRSKLTQQKQLHKSAMATLEAISSDMHDSRRLVSNLRRTAPDGASTVSSDDISIQLSTCDSLSVLDQGFSKLPDSASMLVQSLASPACQRRRLTCVSSTSTVKDHPLMCAPQIFKLDSSGASNSSTVDNRTRSHSEIPNSSTS